MEGLNWILLGPTQSGQWLCRHFGTFPSELRLQPRKSFIPTRETARPLIKEGRPCSHWPGLSQGSSLTQLPLLQAHGLYEYLIDPLREHRPVYHVGVASRHGTSPTLPNRLLPLPILQRPHLRVPRKQNLPFQMRSRKTCPSPLQRRGADSQSPNASRPSWTTCKATSS